MEIAFGTDETTALTRNLVAHLRQQGHEVRDVADGARWPDVGRTVAEEVANGKADFGIVCCWTGTGVSIAANKVPGVRAALCTDAETARGARKWNDANMLAFGLRLTTETVAREMVGAFFGTEPEADERENIAKLS